jgi:hypothetical protein
MSAEPAVKEVLWQQLLVRTRLVELSIAKMD